jgi:hypothetical protein
MADFDRDQMADVVLRKSAFRREAKEYLAGLKYMADRPGSLARLLEQAFKAGQAASPDAAPMRGKPNARTRRMTEDDLPSLTRQMLYSLRSGMFGSGYVDEPGEGVARSFVALYSPGETFRGVPVPRAGAGWSYLRTHGRRDLASAKWFGPLVKAGLFDEHDFGPLRIAILSEWGFELLKTGSTTLPENREAGKSATFGRYRAVRQADPDHLRNALEGLGVKIVPDEPDEEPSAGPSSI